MNSDKTIEIRRPLILLTLAAFASSASFRVCDPMLPILARLFGQTYGQVALVITVFTISYGGMQLIYGPLGERLDRFRVITLATACCALGSMGAAVAPSIEWLVACRLLTGVAAAGIIPLSMAWIADRVEADKRQSVLARFFSGQIMGMVFGQVLGGLFVDAGVWRFAFWGLSLLYVLIAFALWRHIDNSRTEKKGENRPAASLGSLYLTAFRLIYARETRGVLFCFLMEAALVFAVIAFMPLYLHEHFGVALSKASLALVLYGLGGLLFSVFAARMGARLNRFVFPMMAACMVAVANSVIFLSSQAAWVFAAAMISGFGYYMLHNALLFQVTQRVPQARSLALTLAVSIFFVGQSIGVGIAGWLVDQGRLPQVFIWAAVGMPVIGWLTGRRVRAF